MIITNIWNQTPASGAGTLTATYTSNGGYVEILFAGSAWCNSSSGTLIGANLSITPIGFVTSSQVIANEPNSHRALVPASVVVKLPAGTHNLSISALNAQTKIDQNDYFTLTLTELSFA